MAHWQCNIFINEANGDWGASEVYWISASDIDGAELISGNLVTKRLAILSARCKIAATRLSDDAEKGDSYFPAAQQLQPGGIASTEQLVDPWSCLLVQIRSGGKYRGRKFLHGVVKSMFLPNSNQYDPDNAFNAAVEDYISYLQDGDFLIKHRTNSTKPFTYEWQVVSDSQYQWLTTHHIGRPFGGYRGRRSKRKKEPSPPAG